MNKIVKFLAPWYNPQKATEREEKTEVIRQEALIAISHSDRMVQSYYEYSEKMRGMKNDR